MYKGSISFLLLVGLLHSGLVGARADTAMGNKKPQTESKSKVMNASRAVALKKKGPAKKTPVRKHMARKKNISAPKAAPVMPVSPVPDVLSVMSPENTAPAMRGPYERKTVDKVLAIIYHSEGSELILQSDLRPDLSDTMPTLQDAILKKLIILDGKRLKLPVSDADVDRHIARVQEQLKMTRDDLTVFFKERGYTFAQARKELANGLLIEMTIEQRVKTKAFVPHAEIEKYHRENPIVFYDIKQRYLPFEMGSHAIQRAMIDRDIDSGDFAKADGWSDVVSLKEGDISLEKNFIKGLAPGTVVRVDENEQGTSLLLMVGRREVSLAERKQDIMMTLGRDRSSKALRDYYDSLLQQKRDTRVRYIDESLRPILERAPHQVGAPS